MKRTIEQDEALPIVVALGGFAYINQADDAVIVTDPKAAADLANALIDWAASKGALYK